MNHEISVIRARNTKARSRNSNSPSNTHPGYFRSSYLVNAECTSSVV